MNENFYLYFWSTMHRSRDDEMKDKTSIILFTFNDFGSLAASIQNGPKICKNFCFIWKIVLEQIGQEIFRQETSICLGWFGWHFYHQLCSGQQPSLLSLPHQHSLYLLALSLVRVTDNLLSDVYFRFDNDCSGSGAVAHCEHFAVKPNIYNSVSSRVNKT